ncbi:EF-Hand 1, calcium-binding site [Sesbania bispinosa]|nr:EF-Hand 1, calcium-binding site [Sesbania bispinosa]
MLKSFFTLLHYKARFFFTQLKNGCYRTGQPNKSSSSNLVVSSFVDMGMSSQFKQVFKLIDTNGDGKISATELSELLSCLGYRNSIAAKEAEGMVSLLDSNGDGFGGLG